MKNLQIIRHAPLIVGVILSALVPAGAFAQNDLTALIVQSDLVFQGVVERIEYRMSEPGGLEGTSVPYTYVTYLVNQVIRGEAEDEITLRFLGGLDKETGLYLRPSNAPQFDLGDEDVLFVQGNTERFVPLVDDVKGRLRVINGQVYNEDGHSVNIADDGSLVLGGRYLLVEAATTMINDRAMVRDLGPKAIVGPSDAMSPADLVRDLTSIGEIAPAPFAPFVSANIDETVAAPDMIPAPPPVLPRSELNTGKVSGERTEVQPAVPPRRK